MVGQSSTYSEKPNSVDGQPVCICVTHDCCTSDIQEVEVEGSICRVQSRNLGLEKFEVELRS